MKKQSERMVSFGVSLDFGLFYAPLSLLELSDLVGYVASTWQITIVAGILLTPFFAVDPLHKKNSQ